MDYVSSAGLRLFLTLQEDMFEDGSMVVRNVKPGILSIFKLTGFDDIITIE